MAEPVFNRNVLGSTATGAPAVTTIRVPAGGDRVALALGGQEEFTVSLIEADLVQLIVALLVGGVSYVASQHPVHGRVLLNVRPAGDSPFSPLPSGRKPGPRVLAVTLPDQGTCRVVFDIGQALDLLYELDAASELLDQAPGPD